MFTQLIRTGPFKALCGSQLALININFAHMLTDNSEGSFNDKDRVQLADFPRFFLKFKRNASYVLRT